MSTVHLPDQRSYKGSLLILNHVILIGRILDCNLSSIIIRFFSTFDQAQLSGVLREWHPNLLTVQISTTWKRGRGFQKITFSKESMGFNWNFQRGGEIQTKRPSMGGVWIVIIFTNMLTCQPLVHVLTFSRSLMHLVIFFSFAIDTPSLVWIVIIFTNMLTCQPLVHVLTFSRSLMHLVIFFSFAIDTPSCNLESAYLVRRLSMV